MTQTRTKDIVVGVPQMRYAITAPLFDGRVAIDGVRLEPSDVPPAIYDDVPDLREGNFGLCDLNLGYWLPAIEAGWQVVAIPVFTLRNSGHQSLYVRTDRGINGPADLAGKTLATRTFRTASTIWTRGFLHHRHGVDPYSIRWYNQMVEVFPIHDESMPRDPGDGARKHPLDALQDGDVDAAIAAIFGARSFEAFESDARVEHLFPDYIAQDEQLFDDTGIVTPGRVLMMSKKLDEQHPELALKLFNAFEAAKQIAYQELYSDRTRSPVLFFRERLYEQKTRYGDPYAYGVKANRAALDTFMQYNLEQGLIKAPLVDEQIFARSTLDT